jgi:hypothetical protein
VAGEERDSGERTMGVVSLLARLTGGFSSLVAKGRPGGGQIGRGRARAPVCHREPAACRRSLMVSLAGCPSWTVFENRSASHITHELANILISGRTLGADLRSSPGKLLAYRRFDRGCLSASQLLQKCPVYPLVCRISYDSHCIEHCRRSYFAALLVSTLVLRASIHRRGKQ